MTAERVRAMQARQPAAPLQMITVTIRSLDPLTVELPGGALVTGRAVAGLTYVVDALATALVQEPAVGPILPLT